MADLFVVLDSVTDPFSAGMKRAAADAEAQSKRMSSALGLVTKVGLGVGVAVGGIAVASVKAASDFQANMTKLSTAAGAPKAAVQAATGEILKMGTQVGMTGTQMAEALYHPVSAGLDMATSLQVVKYAAEEAQISGANLDDTTYSLSSVMKAFNYPASQAANTMAMLNAVVGDGDMRFQDFNVSIKNWAPTAAQMGISIQSMGAGLAYLTDRGNSAEEASTRLTMGLSMMTTPSAKAAKLLEGLGVASSDVKGSTDAMTQVLKASGITQNQLAEDLSKPDGLYVALSHLQEALHKAGVKGTEADSAIAKVFGGGRSDKAILSLLQNLDGLKQKYDQIGTDATPSKFQDNWETTKRTFAFQMQQMKVAAENLGIGLGMRLLPVLSGVISKGESALGQVASGFTGAALKPVQHAPAHSAFMNQELSAPSLTGWQKFGQEVHTVLTDIEQGAKKLEPVGMDFVRFGGDVWQALGKISHVAGPVAHDLGVGLYLGAKAAGTIFKDVLGPGIKAVGDFIGSHETLFRIFADVVIGGLAVKMGVLGSINAAKGLIDLAGKIAQFPMNQVNQITGAFGDLKTKASGALDKVLPDSAKMAGLAKLGQEMGGVERGITGVEQAAAKGEQLALFETNMSGVVQVAEQGPQQLALFETGVTNVATEAETAEKSVGRFSGVMGKLTLAGGMAGVILGVGLLANELGKFLGVGDHTGGSLDKLQTSLQLAGEGSMQARNQFTQTAVAMVAMDGAMSKMGMHAQGLKDVDTSLSQLVTSGHAQQAKDQFNDIAAALQKQGIDAQKAAGMFPGYEQAIKDAGDAAQTFDGKVQDSINSMQRSQGLNQFSTDLGSLQQQLKDSGNALTGTSAAASANQQQFQSLALEMSNFYQQERNSGVGADQATADYQNQYIALESLAIATLGSKDAADKFLGTLNLIKPNYDTTINLNVGKAYQDLNGLLQAIDSSVGYVQITGTTGGQSTGGKAYVYDDGGFVPGPKGMAVPAILHAGEYVVSNNMQAGRQPIDPKVLSGMAGRASTGYVPGAGAAANTVVNYYVTQHVQGSVLGRIELENLVVEILQQRKLRNSTSGAI